MLPRVWMGEEERGKLRCEGALWLLWEVAAVVAAAECEEREGVEKKSC